MRKVAKMEIYWTGDMSAADRAVVEDESDKMLDEKMQEKKVLRRMLLIIGESDEMYWRRDFLMRKMAKMEIY